MIMQIHNRHTFIALYLIITNYTDTSSTALRSSIQGDWKGEQVSNHNNSNDISPAAHGSTFPIEY